MRDRSGAEIHHRRVVAHLRDLPRAPRGARREFPAGRFVFRPLPARPAEPAGPLASRRPTDRRGLQIHLVAALADGSQGDRLHRLSRSPRRHAEGRRCGGEYQRAVHDLPRHRSEPVDRDRARQARVPRSRHTRQPLRRLPHAEDHLHGPRPAQRPSFPQPRPASDQGARHAERLQQLPRRQGPRLADRKGRRVVWRQDEHAGARADPRDRRGPGGRRLAGCLAGGLRCRGNRRVEGHNPAADGTLAERPARRGACREGRGRCRSDGPFRRGVRDQPPRRPAAGARQAAGGPDEVGALRSRLERAGPPAGRSSRGERSGSHRRASVRPARRSDADGADRRAAWQRGGGGKVVQAGDPVGPIVSRATAGFRGLSRRARAHAGIGEMA